MNPRDPAWGTQKISATRSAESGLSFWLTLLASLVCFAAFLIVLHYVYRPQPDSPQIDLSKIPQEEQWKYTPEGRSAHFVALQTQEQKAATSYAWIDRDKRILQVPIKRAMELTIRKYQSGGKK